MYVLISRSWDFYSKGKKPKLENYNNQVIATLCSKVTPQKSHITEHSYDS